MGKVPCPACAQPTLEERGAYDICDVCGWEDDGTDTPWTPSDPNGGRTLWTARLDARRPRLRGQARARELQRLRDEAIGEHAPPYLAALSRTLGTTLDLGDITRDVVEADRLSLAIHNDGRSSPSPDTDDRPMTADEVDAALATANPRPPALLLDLRYEALFGGVRVDPRVAVARWRAYVDDQSPYLVLTAPDLSGTLSIMPSGGGWLLTVTDAWM